MKLYRVNTKRAVAIVCAVVACDAPRGPIGPIKSGDGRITKRRLEPARTETYACLQPHLIINSDGEIETAWRDSTCTRHVPARYWVTVAADGRSWTKDDEAAYKMASSDVICTWAGDTERALIDVSPKRRPHCAVRCHGLEALTP